MSMNNKTQLRSSPCIDVLNVNAFSRNDNAVDSQGMDYADGSNTTGNTPNKRIEKAFIIKNSTKTKVERIEHRPNISPSGLNLALGFVHWWKGRTNETQLFSNIHDHDPNLGQNMNVLKKVPSNSILSEKHGNLENEKGDLSKPREQEINKLINVKRGCWSSMSHIQVDKVNSTPDDDDDKNDGNKTSTRKLLQIFSTFADRTSLPGAPFLRSSGGHLARTVWGFVLLTMLSGLTFHLYLLFSSFLSYPKFTELSLGFQPLGFPAVTLCNVNPARSSKMKLASKELRALVRHIQPLTMIQERGRLQNIYKDVSTVVKHTKIKDVVDVATNNVNKDIIKLKNIVNQASGDSHTRINESTQESTNITTVKSGRKKKKKNKESTLESTNTTTITTRSPDVATILTTTAKSGKKKKKKNKRIRRFSFPSLSDLTAEQSSLPQTAVDDIESKVDDIKSKVDDVELKMDDVDAESRDGVKTTTDSMTNNKSTISASATALNEVITSNPSSSFNSSGASSQDLKQTSDANDATIMPFMQVLDSVGIDFKSPKRKIRRGILGIEDPFKDISISSAIVEEFKLLFSKENRSTRVQLGHQIEDMLVDCSFNGNRCYPDNFTLLTSTTFGNCFTIDHPKMIARKSGFQNGLSLIVFLQQKVFLTGLTSATGGHLVLHPRDTIPFPDDEGLSVPAGMEVDIALKLIQINRLSQPYGDCDDGLMFFKGITYTLQTCQHFCRQRLVIQRCGCHNSEDEEVILAFGDSLDQTSRTCSTGEDYKCVLGVSESLLNQSIECDCKNPCSETVFSKSISMRQWPSQEYATILSESVCQRLPPKECQYYKTLNPEAFAKNFIKLNIYYEDLNYENVTEKPSYESIQFFSDIGGTMGLWLGLSMITIMEFGHLLINLTKFAMTRIRHYV